MKKLLIVMAAAVLLCGCAARPAPQEPAQPEQKSLDECMREISLAADQIWPGRYELTLENNIVTLSSWSDDAMPGIRNAIAGDAASRASWENMADSFVALSKTIREKLDGNGHKDTGAFVSILDPANRENMLFLAVDGEAIYDPVKGLDAYGINAHRADVVEQYLAEDLPEEIAVDAVGGFDRVTVTMSTPYAKSSRPDSWETLCDAVASKLRGFPDYIETTVTIEAKDGAILGSFAKGKLVYDLYNKAG